MYFQIHYEKYNKRFGEDGIHDPLQWDYLKDQLEQFKRESIFSEIIQTEKSEKSMLEWLTFLPIHTFEPRHFENSKAENTPLKEAWNQVMQANFEAKNGEEPEEKRAKSDE